MYAYMNAETEENRFKFKYTFKYTCAEVCEYTICPKTMQSEFPHG